MSDTKLGTCTMLFVGEFDKAFACEVCGCRIFLYPEPFQHGKYVCNECHATYTEVDDGHEV